MSYGFLSDTRITNLWLGTAGPPRAEATSRVAYLLVEAVAAGAGWAARGVAAGLRALARRFNRRHVRVRTIRELQRLDDAVLRDIGIERAAIPEVVDGILRPQAPEASRPLRSPRRAPRPRIAVPLRAAENPACCPA